MTLKILAIAEPLSCAPDTASFHQALEHAVAVGLTDRQASSISRKAEEEHQADKERQEAESLLRATAVIGAIPLAVRRAVSASLSWDTRVLVPLMELTSAEYPGPFLRMPAQEPESSLDPQKLAAGGRAVWQYLQTAGLTPALQYVMDDDIRRYKLAIVIEMPIGERTR